MGFIIAQDNVIITIITEAIIFKVRSCWKKVEDTFSITIEEIPKRASGI